MRGGHEWETARATEAHVEELHQLDRRYEHRILGFGKFCGYRFRKVAGEAPKYCAWVRDVPSSNCDRFLEFQYYLRGREVHLAALRELLGEDADVEREYEATVARLREARAATLAERMRTSRAEQLIGLVETTDVWSVVAGFLDLCDFLCLACACRRIRAQTSERADWPVVLAPAMARRRGLRSDRAAHDRAVCRFFGLPAPWQMPPLTPVPDGPPRELGEYVRARALAREGVPYARMRDEVRLAIQDFKKKRGQCRTALDTLDEEAVARTSAKVVPSIGRVRRAVASVLAFHETHGIRTRTPLPDVHHDVGGWLRYAEET